MFDPPASNQAAGQSADDGAPLPDAADLAAELARVREQLRFYESFDTLIRDNVLRSGELLRQVAAEREQTDQKLLDMRAEVDRRLAEQRSALEEIAEGLSGLQANLGALAERVSGSLSALPDHGSPSLPDAPTGAAISTDHGPTLAQPSAEGAARGAVPAPSVAGAADRVNGDDLRVPELHVGATPVPAIAATAQAVEPTVDRDSADVLEPVADPASSHSVSDDAGPVRRKIDLIVHGVPRAATALSLQRHLQELSGVEAVEVREYVSGVLRFQVLAAALGPDDFRAWPSGDGLEVVTVRDHVLELKLPSADGF